MGSGSGDGESGKGTWGSISTSMDPAMGARGPSSASIDLGSAVEDLFLKARTWKLTLGFLCQSVEFRVQTPILSHILKNVF